MMVGCSVLMPRLLLAPVLARSSLRSSLVVVFGCSCDGLPASVSVIVEASRCLSGYQYHVGYDATREPPVRLSYPDYPRQGLLTSSFGAAVASCWHALRPMRYSSPRS